RLVLDAVVLSAIEARFKQLGRWPMPESNRSQAEVPEGATVLPNPRGTAPGLWLEDERGRLVVLLPGVPSEMRGLLAEQVLPRLAQRDGADRPRVVLSCSRRCAAGATAWAWRSRAPADSSPSASRPCRGPRTRSSAGSSPTPT